MHGLVSVSQLRRKGVARLAELATLTIIAMLMSFVLSACMRAAEERTREANVEEFEVTERDLEVARQMDAPEHVIESMESGEWLYPSDREAVRYAELAIDHMMEAHGQLCEARWSTVPWLLSHEAKVNVVAAGGKYDGLAAIVHVSTAEGHPCTDNWYVAVHRDECAQLALEVLEETLAELPREKWAAQAVYRDSVLSGDLADDATIEEALEQVATEVNMYLGESVAPDEDTLETLRVQILRAYKAKGYLIHLWMCVVPDPSDDSAVSMEYGRERVASGEDLISKTGTWRKG